MNAQLVKCPDCGREVSVSAPTCPGCGRREPGSQASTKMKLVIALGAILLGMYAFNRMDSAPVQSGPATDAANAQSQESAWIAEMQSRVRQRMKDPDSAEFRSSRVSHKSGAPVVCGEVNANNSFGGKGGYQRFVASGDIIALEEQMADGEMDKTWAAVCQ